MEEKKQNWAIAIAKVLSKAEMDNVKLGIEIGKLKQSYYYADIIALLKGTSKVGEDIYFGRMKPLYDKYGYEKVNRILLAIDEQEQGGKKDE